MSKQSAMCIDLLGILQLVIMNEIIGENLCFLLTIFTNRMPPNFPLCGNVLHVFVMPNFCYALIFLTEMATAGAGAGAGGAQGGGQWGPMEKILCTCA